MLLFCDESGDPGLPMEPGASAYFALGILCCQDGEEAARLAVVQEGLRSGLGWRGGVQMVEDAHRSQDGLPDSHGPGVMFVSCSDLG